MTITMTHNGQCGTSRKVLEMIRARGIEPVIVEYLKTPLTRGEIAALLGRMGVGPRDVLRAKEAAAVGLVLDSASDDELLDAMAAHPILINRPIVISEKGAKLCRPAEVVEELL